ncbi:ABC transporter ATP-binding protein [Paenibacillus sp. TRM 82003]|nr:ABC transporter ATP-binding protein [Paenibacillus sp. TRM 82003]
MGNALVEAIGLAKRYGKGKRAVDGVDLRVEAGEIVGVIGPNGAGKSTTLDLLLGLKRPDEGEVRYGWPEPRRRVGVQLQATPFFPGLSAAEHLKLFAALYGVRLSAARVRELLAGCGLSDAADVMAGRLSGGQQKRLAIAMALAHDPSLVFLDEPSAALDPRARQEIRSLLRETAARGTAVLFTSHDMEEVEKLADRIVMISAGRVIAAGAPSGLCAAHGVDGLEALYLKLTDEGANAG